MKYTWFSFFLSLVAIRFYGMATDNQSPQIYFFVAAVTVIVFLLTYISELKINPKWMVPIGITLIAQMIGISHIISVSDWGTVLSADTSIPFTFVNPDNYQGLAAEYATVGWMSRSLNYSLLLGIVYKICGVSSLIGEMLSVLFYYSSLELFVKTVRYYDIKIINSEEFKISFLILLFYPQLISESIQIHRELLIIYLLSFSLFFFVKWWKTSKYVYIFLSMIPVVLAGILHGGSIFLAVGIALSIILYSSSRLEAKITVKTFSYLILLLFIGIFVMSRVDFDKFNNLDVTTLALERGNSTGIGGSGYTAGISIGNPILSAIVNTPIKMFYFLFSPLPHNWRGIMDVISFLMSSLLYLIPFFVVLKDKIMNRLDDNLAWSIFLSLGIFSIPFAWGVSNSGTAIRHRSKIIIWLVFLILLLLKNRKSNLKGKSK
ncbi:hypothetical protein P7G51_08865 [Enterococcus asini]|uniref:hypothetical protein n=1 Tax=Enterococcus asini TaxID=57732 RepID=UPI00288F2A14|nr:hypothetical protein [Enterococcus asini]MDT2757486.1 hypothetical protein [Enterococcus asini]